MPKFALYTKDFAMRDTLSIVNERPRVKDGYLVSANGRGKQVAGFYEIAEEHSQLPIDQVRQFYPLKG